MTDEKKPDDTVADSELDEAGGMFGSDVDPGNYGQSNDGSENVEYWQTPAPPAKTSSDGEEAGIIGMF